MSRMSSPIGERTEAVAKEYEERHIATQEALETYEKLAEQYVHAHKDDAITRHHPQFPPPERVFRPMHHRQLLARLASLDQGRDETQADAGWLLGQKRTPSCLTSVQKNGQA